jgi:hypothetical protein
MMNKDQKLLEEAYEGILASSRDPLYFGPEERQDSWIRWLLAHSGRKIHEDGSVSIDRNVSIAGRELKEIPFKFKEIGGFFDCGDNELETLEGCPETVRGSFNCSVNNLKDLSGGPKSVSGSFSCSHNSQLDSLEGAPEVINGNFMCKRCNLSTLKHAPKIVKGDFECYGNNLVSLEGAPEDIQGSFNDTKFTNEDYEAFAKKRRFVDQNLDKDFDIDLGNF